MYSLGQKYKINDYAKSKFNDKNHNLNKFTGAHEITIAYERIIESRSKIKYS